VVKNLNFGQKLIFWSKIKILVKIEILLKNRNFWQIESLAKNQKFGQKRKFL